MIGGAITFAGAALSKNPEHEDVPPAAIAPFFADEALYSRIAWLRDAQVQGYSYQWATIELNMHGIIIPNRQIYVYLQINPAVAQGIVSEFYFREVKLSRAETDLMNITWGKYRR